MIIAIANQKGGVAKTTTTICLGGLLAVESRTLAIDLDPQGNMTTGLKIQVTTEPTSYEVITERIPIKDAIVSTAAKIDLVPADINLAKGEPEIISKVGNFYLLRDAIETIKTEFAYFDRLSAKFGVVDH